MRNWNISKTQYKVGDFISWQRSQNLVLSPSFQRRLVWRKVAKSYLLDTIIRGLPIPIIVLRERQTSSEQLEPTREVVDGQQRIRTVISFVCPALLHDFKLERDEFKIMKTHNKELAGKPFQELPREIRQGILDYQFSVHVLPAEVDDRQILQIFARMNATEVKLNDQELRNAEFFGELKTSVYEQAFKQLNRWRAWHIFTEYSIARMEEVELVSEMYGLMLHGIEGQSQKAINNLYRTKDEAFPEKHEIEARLDTVLDLIDQNLGAQLKTTVFHNRMLFYVLFAVVYNAAYGLGSSFVRKSPNRVSSEVFHAILQRGKELEKATAPKNILDAATRRTTDLHERKLLFDYIKG